MNHNQSAIRREAIELTLWGTGSSAMTGEAQGHMYRRMMSQMTAGY